MRKDVMLPLADLSSHNADLWFFWLIIWIIVGIVWIVRQFR